MYIDKALKKQSKLKRLFFITMGFLSVFLPIIAYLADMKSIFIISYLIVLEILIFIILMLSYFMF